MYYVYNNVHNIKYIIYIIQLLYSKVYKFEISIMIESIKKDSFILICIYILYLHENYTIKNNLKLYSNIYHHKISIRYNMIIL